MVCSILLRVGNRFIPDPAVRLDLVEQLPHVAMICQEAPDRLGDVLPRHLIPIIVRFLRDVDQQVEPTSHPDKHTHALTTKIS